MIVVLHGENVLTSRNELEKIKSQNKDKEILVLNGKKISLTETKQALETSSMFAPGRMIIIENLLTGRKTNTQQEVLTYLAQNPPKVDLILWEEKEVSKSNLTKLLPAKVLLFKPEQILFKFLESIRPDNEKEMLTLLTSCIKAESPEIIFYMLVRQFRLLLLFKDNLTQGIDEVDRLAPWQKERLVRQAKYFSLEELTDIYHQLLRIDYQQKTGQAAFDLLKTLELFVTNL